MRKSSPATSPKSLRLQNKDLSGKVMSAKASGLRAGKPSKPPLTRQEVLDRLQNYLCDYNSDELTALSEVFEKMTCAISRDEMRVTFFDGVNSLEFVRPMEQKTKVVQSLGVDGPVIDFAWSMLDNISLNPFKLMQDWANCPDKDGPSEFVIPLRDE